MLEDTERSLDQASYCESTVVILYFSFFPQSFMITPRTQENFRRIDKEFDHLLRTNQVPPSHLHNAHGTSAIVSTPQCRFLPQCRFHTPDLMGRKGITQLYLLNYREACETLASLISVANASPIEWDLCSALSRSTLYLEVRLLLQSSLQPYIMWRETTT